MDKPEDIAFAVCMVASPRGGFITGANIRGLEHHSSFQTFTPTSGWSRVIPADAREPVSGLKEHSGAPQHCRLYLQEAEP